MRCGRLGLVARYTLDTVSEAASFLNRNGTEAATEQNSVIHEALGPRVNCRMELNTPYQGFFWGRGMVPDKGDCAIIEVEKGYPPPPPILSNTSDPHSPIESKGLRAARALNFFNPVPSTLNPKQYSCPVSTVKPYLVEGCRV